MLADKIEYGSERNRGHEVDDVMLSEPNGSNCGRGEKSSVFGTTTAENR